MEKISMHIRLFIAAALLAAGYAQAYPAQMIPDAQIKIAVDTNWVVLVAEDSLDEVIKTFDEYIGANVDAIAAIDTTGIGSNTAAIASNVLEIAANAEAIAAGAAPGGTTDVARIDADLAYIEDLTVSGAFLSISNDMAASYMGNPKLVLTTNMVTSSDDGGTPIAIAAFTSVFDADVTTYASGVLGSTDNHSYLVDLGAHYTGHAILSIRFAVGSGGGIRAQHLGSTSLNDIGSGIAGTPQVYSEEYGIFRADSTNEVRVTLPLSGRYYTVYHFIEGAGSGTYNIYDVSIYGTTNQYRNMGE